MQVHTKKRRIKISGSSKKPETVSWREAAKKDIRKHSEGGQILRASRYKEEISQKDLAESVGINQHHISEMENGKRPIGKEMAHRFAVFFKTDYRLFL